MKPRRKKKTPRQDGSVWRVVSELDALRNQQARIVEAMTKLLSELGEHQRYNNMVRELIGRNNELLGRLAETPFDATRDKLLTLTNTAALRGAKETLERLLALRANGAGQ